MIKFIMFSFMVLLFVPCFSQTQEEKQELRKAERIEKSFENQRVLYPDTLKYLDLIKGKKPSGDFFGYYVSSNGYVFQSGDSLTFDMPSNGGSYSFIQGESKMGVALLTGVYTVVDISAKAMGSIMRIKKFTVAGSKKSGFKAVAVCSDEISNVNIWLESAFKMGEVK